MADVKFYITCCLAFLLVGCNTDAIHKQGRKSNRITVHVLCDNIFLSDTRIKCCCVEKVGGRGFKEITIQGDEPEYDSIIRYISARKIINDTDKQIDARMNIRVYTGNTLILEACIDNYDYAVYSNSKYLGVNSRLRQYIGRKYCE